MEMNLVKRCSRRTREGVSLLFFFFFWILDNTQRKTEGSSESSVGLFESVECPEEKYVDSSNIPVLVSFVVDTLIGFHNESDDEAVANRLVRRPNSL